MASDSNQPDEQRPAEVRLRCARCGRSTRVPVGRARGPDRCERCDAALPLVHSLSAEDFGAAVLGAPLPVLVDFHAEWCGPCRWLDPVLETLAREFRGRVLVVKVDADEAPDVVQAHRVGSVPTVLLFHDGREAGRSVGIEPERLRAMVDGIPAAAADEAD